MTVRANVNACVRGSRALQDAALWASHGAPHDAIERA
jgi:hypothetical protein